VTENGENQLGGGFSYLGGTVPVMKSGDWGFLPFKTLSNRRPGSTVTPMNYQIWTLNAIAPAVEAHFGRIEALFRKKGISIRRGDRLGFNVQSPDLLKNPPHQLMYSSGDFDEYFVPIPVKCLGRNLMAGRLPRELERSLEKEPWRKTYRPDDYWKKKPIDGNPSVRMNTNGAGYYEILEQTTQNLQKATEAPWKNIIIGYSEGGLVARYLAAIDEQLHQKNPAKQLIHGIVTIGSPNHGSPLANPANDESVAEGLLSTFSLLFLDQSQNRKLIHAIGNVAQKSQFKMEYVDAILGGVIEDAEKRRRPVEGLMRFRKWLSGVLGQNGTAFRDLRVTDIGSGRLARPLELTLRRPLKTTFYGAILNGNPDIGVIAHQALKWWEQPIFDLLTRWGRLRRARRCFSHNVMRELGPKTRQAKALVRLYPAGVTNSVAVPPLASYSVTEGAIVPFQHDFVIPTYSMLLPDPQPGRSNFLGNYVVAEANHLSGAKLSRTFSILLKILKKMEPQTPRAR
jgi:hypothetical protein